MADPQVGKRYAQAAFAIAEEAGTVVQWRSDLADIATVLAESEIAPVLADGRIPLQRRLELVERTLDIQPAALNLAKLLVQKGRSTDADAVAAAFNAMADEAEGVVDAHVTTAVDLTEEQLRAIEAKLSATTGKRVRASAAIDPSVGMVVRIGDRVVDGSVRTRLKRLRRELGGVR